jgi:hypothetical protein
MKDTRTIEQLREALANVDMAMGNALDGFNLDFVGFDCPGAIDFSEPWACPFQPGCGAKNLNECPEAKKRARVLAPPQSRQ